MLLHGKTKIAKSGAYSHIAKSAAGDTAGRKGIYIITQGVSWPCSAQRLTCSQQAGTERARPADREGEREGRRVPRKRESGWEGGGKGCEEAMRDAPRFG